LKEIAASYFGKITMIDDYVGKIIEAYKRKGWWNNTVVIFASDHGEMLGDLGRVSKSICYEPAVRVPLIIRLADGTGAGRVVDSFVETIDIYRTILEAAGAEPARRRDSRSLLPVVKGTVGSVARRRSRRSARARDVAYPRLEAGDWPRRVELATIRLARRSSGTKESNWPPSA